MRRIRAALLAGVIFASALWPVRAAAVGWDNDDFLVIGAPNFSQYIGVFDHDFTFKGYLETNFLGVRGMDFDSQGRLVAVSYLNPEVRVYNPDGARAGGFTKATSPLLESGGDLKVAPDGNYVLGTNTNGVKVFTPQGTFVRQYGDGVSQGVTFVPGNRLWVAGLTTTVRIFDTDTGAQVGSFTPGGQVNAGSLIYSPFTNTVLMVDGDRDAGGVFERDLAGNLLHEFRVPHPQTSLNGAVRLPAGDIYGTHDWYAPSYPDLIHWSADGAVLEEKAIWPVQIKTGRILWAGSVPEPNLLAGVGAVAGLLAAHPAARRTRRARPAGNRRARRLATVTEPSARAVVA
jgi:hypothetical protein